MKFLSLNSLKAYSILANRDELDQDLALYVSSTFNTVCNGRPIDLDFFTSTFAYGKLALNLIDVK